jgi:hypothetical protein
LCPDPCMPRPWVTFVDLHLYPVVTYHLTFLG